MARYDCACWHTSFVCVVLGGVLVGHIRSLIKHLLLLLLLLLEPEVEAHLVPVEAFGSTQLGSIDGFAASVAFLGHGVVVAAVAK
jgi:hypothetical protein